MEKSSVNWQLVQVDWVTRSCSGCVIDTLNEFCRSAGLFRRGRVAYSSDDLVEMRRRVLARIHQRIQALDGQTGAAKPEQGVRRGDEAEGSRDGV